MICVFHGNVKWEGNREQLHLNEISYRLKIILIMLIGMQFGRILPLTDHFFQRHRMFIHNIGLLLHRLSFLCLLLLSFINIYIIHLSHATLTVIHHCAALLIVIVNMLNNIMMSSRCLVLTIYVHLRK